MSRCSTAHRTKLLTVYFLSKLKLFHSFKHKNDNRSSFLAKHIKPTKIRQKYDVGGVRTLVYVRWCTYAGVRTYTGVRTLVYVHPIPNKGIRLTNNYSERTPTSKQSGQTA